MEFLHASIALLASMVLVLAGMVGWLYWQQTRLFQNMNSIVMVIGELARPQVNLITPQLEEEEITAPVAELVDEIEIDDRASVDAEVSAPMADIVDGAMDTDSLQDKTAADLKEMLTKKGIPFGKRDSKGVLISLLKATA